MIENNGLFSPARRMVLAEEMLSPLRLRVSETRYEAGVASLRTNVVPGTPCHVSTYSARYAALYNSQILEARRRS